MARVGVYDPPVTPYDQSLQELYRASLGEFLAERKRLSEDLRARRDKAGATQLARRRKPTASVWAVNQLYWSARAEVDAMLAAAARVRGGQLDTSTEYHRRLADLRKRAAALLAKHGHSASDAVLRRIGTTLAAIGAAGGFAPDPPGALAADRDPPGFEGFALANDPMSGSGRRAQARAEDARKHARLPAARSDVAHDGSATRQPGVVARASNREEEKNRKKEERSRAAAESKRLATERKRLAAERRRLGVEARRLRDALRAAQAEERRREHALRELRTRVETESRALDEAHERSRELSRRLGELEGSAQVSGSRSGGSR